MRTLYHYTLCPFSRKIRLVLAEKKLDFELEFEKTWERRTQFLQLNHAGYVPVLRDLNGTVVAESSAIAEYLEEVYPAPPLLAEDCYQRAEARRLSAWFDDRFAREVSITLLFEKALKRYYYPKTSPLSTCIRAAKQRIHYYLDYLAWLIEQRRWLAGEFFSFADITVAAHLSTVDYFGDVPWDIYPAVKEWYARIKSRPSFKSLLNDRIVGHLPCAHYNDLDF